MKLAPNYLQRTGYRLPTDAEMEYATRAGAATCRYFGQTEELLANYAWYMKNAQERSWPVGSKKPNDLGFFDVLGNVYTWCQETFKLYPATKGGEINEDLEDLLSISVEKGRVFRGGSFSSIAAQCRSAIRVSGLPRVRSYIYGFRPARTFTP
jgi:formylglycine-generating enzyme required for sulfatase activity